MILWFIILLIFIVIIGLFHFLITNKNRIAESFETLKTVLALKSGYLQDLRSYLTIAKNGNPESPENILETLDTPATRISSLQALESLDRDLSEKLLDIQETIERNPETITDNRFYQRQKEQEKVEEKLAVAIRAYNDTVYEYNNTMEIFPTSIIAGIINYQTEKPFESRE